MSWILRSKQFGLGITRTLRQSLDWRFFGLHACISVVSSTAKRYGTTIRQAADDPCPGRFGGDLRRASPARTLEPAATLDCRLGPDLHSLRRAGVRNAGPSFDFRCH